VLIVKSHGNHGIVGSGGWWEGQQLEMSAGLPAAGMEIGNVVSFHMVESVLWHKYSK